MMLDKNVRLVTLIGLGGTGKTRLALAAAESLEGVFLEGISYTALSAVSDVDGLYSAIAQSLGVQLHGQEAPSQQITDYLRGKEVLLVLDNFEQIRGGAKSLAPLFDQAPGVKLLVTSRRRLNLPWELIYQIEGLPFYRVDSVLGSPAGQLFLQATQRVNPEYAVTALDAEHIHRICAMVEGLPLGIETAASWMRLLSCAEIAREIEQDQTFFSTSQLKGHERHQSLWATFEYSWRMLSPDEKTLLKKLSVCRGGFTSQAGMEISGGGRGTLLALADKPLVQATKDGRFQMHELLRKFAAEKLAESASELSAAEDAHSHTYLEWLASYEADLQSSWLEAVAKNIQTDWENVRFAWQRAVQHKSFDLIDKSLTALYKFCNLRQHYRAGKSLFQDAVEAASSEPNLTILVARLRLALGTFYYYLGVIDKSLSAFNESKPVLLEGELIHEYALNLMWEGFARQYMGSSSKGSDGVALLKQSLEIFTSLGDEYYQARCLGNPGNIWAGGELRRSHRRTEKRAGPV